MSVEETAAYFDTFDVQTLGYRAPEVIYGAKFGVAIDMWSLGVTLAELASGRALVQAASRGGLAVQVAQLLGQPPPRLFGDAKYASELSSLVKHTPAALSVDALRQRLTAELGSGPSQPEALLVDLVARLLQYDPAARLSPAQALAHPFLAPLFPFGALVDRAPPKPTPAEPPPPPPKAEAKAEAAPPDPEPAGSPPVAASTSAAGGGSERGDAASEASEPAGDDNGASSSAAPPPQRKISRKRQAPGAFWETGATK